MTKHILAIHFQATMNEVVEFKGRQQNSYTWVVAFPLPVFQPGY